MKRTDIAAIILVASISVIISYFVVSSLPIFQASQKPVSVQTFEEISPDLKDVDTSVFNKDAINPSVEVIIGGNGTTTTPTDTQTETDSDE